MKAIYMTIVCLLYYQGVYYLYDLYDLCDLDCYLSGV